MPGKNFSSIESLDFGIKWERCVLNTSKALAASTIKSMHEKLSELESRSKPAKNNCKEEVLPIGESDDKVVSNIDEPRCEPRHAAGHCSRALKTRAPGRSWLSQITGASPRPLRGHWTSLGGELKVVHQVVNPCNRRFSAKLTPPTMSYRWIQVLI